MNYLRSRRAAAGFAIALSNVLGVPALGATAAQSSVPDPGIKLITAQAHLALPTFRRSAFLDPGIWVASLGSALQLDVQRASYTQPVTLTQIIRTPWGTTRYRPLPAAVLDGWKGLRDFIRLTVRNHSG